MATRFASFQFGAATNAMIQQSAQFFEDTLVTTGGWVVTADTGQTLPSALIAPTAISQSRGFRIYRMNDALQATFPVFMRVDYGSSANSASAFGVYLTFGTGTNGAGTITPAALTNLQVGQPQTTANTYYCYGSAAPNRLCLGIPCLGGFTFSFYLFIERSKDSSGNDTGDGLILIYGPNGSGNNYNALQTNKYVIMAGGTQPTEERALSYILSTNNPTQVFAPGDVGLGIIIPMRGVAVQPGSNVMIVNSNDVSNDGQINALIYGGIRTYQHLNNITVPCRRYNGVTDTNARVLMRYD
jgi:hypothetical protein